MRVGVLLLTVAAMIAAAGGGLAHGDDPNDEPPVAPLPADSDQPPLSADELDDLLAPVALYPDPLLAQLLPAATEPQDVAAAHAWVAAGNDPDTVDDQPWDPSVLALARFPAVLNLLADHPDWAEELGYAFATQQADVTESIQRLRAQAQEAGSLVSTPEQEVVEDDDGIQIVPADPQVIFVPVYDPQVVFVRQPPEVVVVRPRIRFGPPVRTGVWLTNDFNWRRGYVRVGGGWRARRGGAWVSVNNRPGVWPRRWFRDRPGWDGRPGRWRPRPGRRPFRPPPRTPVIPGRRPVFPGRPPRPGVPGVRPGRPARPLPDRRPGTNRPRPTNENRGRPDTGNRPGRPGGPQAQRPGRSGGMGDIDRPGGGQRNSDRGRQSRSGSSARPTTPGRDGSAWSAAQNRLRGAQSRGQDGGGNRGGGGGGRRR
jgi:hypothetical protein